MMQKTIEFIQKEPSIWGAISLLCTVALAFKTAIPFDLLVLAAGGFFLSARLQIRGCCYALVLLGLVAAIKHAFLVHDHLWQLGIEGSLGLAFFITALASEQGTFWIESLQSQIATRDATLENLEEELRKSEQMAQEQQIAFQEKAAHLQKELEELQVEHSSILILNEVLRKTAAGYAQENESLSHQASQMRLELQEAEQELDRLKKSDELALQNSQLFKELNQARYDKEQSHLISETLARLHIKESLKAKEADEEAASLKEQLRAVRKTDPDPQIAERLKFAEEKMVHIAQIEPLFNQLKKQFEEKNQILSQTRSDLFKTDTELQKLRLEKAALDLNPFPKEVEKELEELGSQLIALEEENREMQELITILSDPSERKKKVKVKQTPSEQELLF